MRQADNWAWQLWRFEQSQVRYEADPLPGEAAFRYRPGTRPVLLSAPHGACHWRAGRWKEQDGYTAALAHLLAEQTGAHALYTVRRIRPDPNFEDDCDYKRTLARLLSEHSIRLVLDLHGASPDRDFGLALGTIDGRSCPDYEASIIQALGREHFAPDQRHFLDRLAVNPPPFRGGAKQQTVTRFVWEQCKVNAAQVEINSHLRTIHCRPAALAAAVILAAEPVRQQRLIRALLTIVLAV